jgi:hypothetical protein
MRINIFTIFNNFIENVIQICQVRLGKVVILKPLLKNWLEVLRDSMFHESPGRPHRQNPANLPAVGAWIRIVRERLRAPGHSQYRQRARAPPTRNHPQACGKVDANEKRLFEH